MASMASMTSAASMASMGPAASKREGDISDAFGSFTGNLEKPLPDRFRQLKLSLVAGHEKDVEESWKRLLAALRTENARIAAEKSSIIPVVHFDTLDSDLSKLRREIRKRGAAVIRGVIPEAEARAYKTEVEEYVKKNPSTRGFPAKDRQVFELYWSAPQLKARAHPNLLRTQRALLENLWHAEPKAANSAKDPLIDLSTPLSYADRLRIRQPGDASFSLGPHQDGGSVERWEREGYGRGGVYDAIFAGRWDAAAAHQANGANGATNAATAASAFDPWDAGARVDAVSNLYDGLGACTMFRAFQGWLSMSHSGPGQGTLQVYPEVTLSTVYTLLRPFFRPVRGPEEFGADGSVESDGFLSAENWVFTAGAEMTSALHGAWVGTGQEFSTLQHPHLELGKTMVHMPDVKPGDFVVWHCDSIHAVDPKHNGTSDSSVIYIPVCPVTQINAQYLARQRQAFLDGTPGPDFPGGKGESEHVDRPTEQYLRAHAGAPGLQAFGFEKLVVPDGIRPGARAVLEKANEILGF